MDTDQGAALERAGVTRETLTPAERQALDERGFVVLPGVLDGRALAELREAFERALRRPTGGPPPDAARGTRHIETLPPDEPCFDVVYATPRVLAALQHVLRRAFRLFQASGRDPLPGFGQQGLHQDWVPRSRHEPARVASALWLLDAFTRSSGATRVVPGSHVTYRPLPRSMQAPEAGHPEEELVLAQAGSVLVFNGHLWHSGTRNDGTEPRRVLQCQFVGREVVPPGQEKGVPERLPAPVRALFGS